MDITPPRSEEPSTPVPEKISPAEQNLPEPIEKTRSAKQVLTLDPENFDPNDPWVQKFLQLVQENQQLQSTSETSNFGSTESEQEVKVKTENGEGHSEPGVCVKIEATSPGKLATIKGEESTPRYKRERPARSCIQSSSQETSTDAKPNASDSEGQDASPLTSEGEGNITGEYLDETSDDGDDSDLDRGKSISKSRKTATQKSKRRPPVKNPREWVARKREVEASKKRKRDEEAEASRKAQKVGKNLLGRLSDTNVNDPDMDIPVMPEIRAKTHKEQAALLRMMVPDTRHAQNQKRELKEAYQLFGYTKVKAVNGKYKLKGMKSALESYQQVASSWMVQRELDEVAPYGGIVADAPGFGKTVISLNTIMGHPAFPEDLEEFGRTTLIVVPNREVANQWLSEILKHCVQDNKTISVIYNNGGGWLPESLKSMWIVIATYRDLWTQFPSKKRITELKEEAMGDSDAFERAKCAELGVLFQASWYRVILDEAHQIKNRKSQAAQACWELHSKFRWALTGTPLSNDAGEFYPYLRFLECNFTGDHKRYLKTYCPDGITDAKFDALIGKIMLRRTQKDQFLGHRILDIPAGETHDLWVPLSEEEQAIYKVVDVHYEEQIANCEADIDEEERGASEEAQCHHDSNGEDKDEEEASRMSKHMLLRARFQRLRQAVSHPFNLEKCFRETVCHETIQKLQSTLADIKHVSIEKQLRDGDGFDKGLAKYDKGFQDVEAVNHSAFGGRLDMHQLLTLVNNEKLIKGIEYLNCKDKDFHFKPVQAANCDHINCQNCIEIAADDKRKIQAMPCRHPDCNKKLGVGSRLDTLAQIQHAAKVQRFQEPGRDFCGVQLRRKTPESNGFYLASQYVAGITLPPSSKLTAAVSVIMTWDVEAPGDKIIVFSEYVMTSKVLGRMLEEARIGFVYYNGDISDGEKTRALKAFRESPKVKVLLASMKCGGQSLNLTEANRVIILDLWWNNSLEQQAFGRVRRRGQTKKTYLVRIMTKGGIDERIAELQRTKSEIVDRALQDDGHLLKPLHKDELEMLFSSKENGEAEAGRKARARRFKASGDR